jgi:two-component system OmpR family response regulator
MSQEPHILVVDDHREIRDLIARYLQRHGFRVSTATNGVDMTRMIRNGAIDLVVLDIMMPGEDGLSLCRKNREQDGPPVILLTAMSEETDRIVGLEVGADDYLVKPFNPRELLARIRAVLRRIGPGASFHGKANQHVVGWKFDRWHLRADGRVLTHSDGAEQTLSSGEFKILSAMLQRANTVLSRDQLLDICHGRSANSFDRAIDNQISRLRAKLEENRTQPKLIQTAWGDGYKLCAEVTSL